MKRAFLASDDVLLRSLLEDLIVSKPSAASPRRGEVGKAASDETGHVVEESLGLPALTRTLKHQLSLSAEGPDVPAMVMALLPRSMPPDIREDLSNALALVVRDRTFVHDSWPLIYSGLTNLGSAIIHIHRIARLMQQRVDWLLAIWEREITRVEIKAAREVLASITANATCGGVRSAIEDALTDIRELLPRSVFAADKIEPWLNRIVGSQSDTLLEDVLVDGTTGRPSTPLMKEQLRQAISDRHERETIWSAVSPSADGAVAYGHYDLIRSFHRSLVALDDKRVLLLSQRLARRKPRSGLTSAYISRTIHVKRHEADVLGQIMAETYSPNLQRLGIQLRLILTKNALSAFQTNGLCEKLLIDDQRYNLALAFVEPSGSPGPAESTLDGSRHIVADSKTVSMCFHTSDDERSSGSKHSRRRNDRLILSIGGPAAKRATRPSPREVDTMGLLWGMDGTGRRREELLNRCQVPKSTRAYTRDRILQERMMSVMWHPRLEYSGLPDGLLIAASRVDARDRDRFRNWLLDAAAYVEVLENHPKSGTCDIVATVRVPKGDVSVLGTMAQGELADLGVEPEDYVLCRIRRQSTYRLSALGRIFDDRACEWTDPWSKMKA